FRSDPRLSGWTFDFDMGSVGAKLDPDNARPVMDDATIATRWNPTSQALIVESMQPGGPSREVQRPVPGQRQRFVRPVVPLGNRETASLECTLTVDAYGDGKRPLWLGFFETGSPLAGAVLALRPTGPTAWSLVASGNGWKRSVRLAFTRRVRVGMPVRVEIRVDPRQSSVGAAVFSARTRIGIANLVMGAGEHVVDAGLVEGVNA
ncbi:MAG: hypothetical protein ACOVT5_08095, partial [Armatimonadaceae bacterium]